MTKQEILLAKIALKKKYITQQQLEECLRLQKNSERPKPLVILMIEQGFISDKELEAIVQYQQKYQQKIQSKKENIPEKKSAESKKSEKSYISCGFCKKKIPENLPFCPHCKTQFMDVSKAQMTLENAYYCGFCNGPITELDEKCPKCGAVFTTLESLNEQVYSCANCKNLVSLSDRKCPNCGAQFDD